MPQTYNAAEFRVAWDAAVVLYAANYGADETDVFGVGLFDLRSVDSGGLWDVTLPTATPNSQTPAIWTDGTYTISLSYDDLGLDQNVRRAFNAIFADYARLYTGNAELATLLTALGWGVVPPVITDPDTEWNAAVDGLQHLLRTWYTETGLFV